MKIGKRIRELRKYKKLSLQALAIKAGYVHKCSNGWNTLTEKGVNYLVDFGILTP